MSTVPPKRPSRGDFPRRLSPPKIDVGKIDSTDLELVRQAAREAMQDPWAHGIGGCIMCGGRALTVSGMLNLPHPKPGWGQLLVYVLCGECEEATDDDIRAHALRSGGGVQ